MLRFILVSFHPNILFNSKSSGHKTDSDRHAFAVAAAKAREDNH